MEKGVFEIIGPYGISNVLFNTGKIISKLDTGIITSYALYIVLGLIGLIFLIFFPIFFNIFDSSSLFFFEFKLVILFIASFILYFYTFFTL